MADAPQIFVNSAGALVPVPAEQAGDAAQLGWEPASPEQIAAHQRKLDLEAKYDNWPAIVNTAALSAASALTGGLSDLALTKSGLVSPETIKGMEETNPTASMVGTGLGIAAPLIASAGTSALAGAAKVTAPSLIARAGQAATEGVTRAITKGAASSLTQQLAARAAGLAAGSAVEGAAYGAGQVVHEYALGDPNLTAQTALAHVGMSAALAGGLGGALGLAEVGIPAAIAKTTDAIGSAFGKAKNGVEKIYASAEKVHGVPQPTAEFLLEHKLEVSTLNQQVPGMAEKLAQVAPDTAASILSNAPQFGALERAFPGINKTLVLARPDTLGLVLRNADRFAQFEREVPGALKNITQANPETAQFFLDNWTKMFRPGQEAERIALMKAVRQGGDNVIGSVEKMFKQAYGEMMKVGAQDLLANANPPAILESYAKLWAKTADAIGVMESRPSLFDKYYPAKLRTILEDLVKDSGKAADPVTAFQHLTRLRQEIGANISWTKQGLLAPAERDAQHLMKGVYREISDALGDEQVFGAAGAAKATLDEAFSGWKRVTERVPGAQLGKSQAGTSNFNFLLMQSGRMAPNKINSWFNKFGDDTAVLKTEAWSEMLDAAKKAAEAVDKVHRAAPVTVFDRKAVEDIIERTAEVARTASERAAVTRQYNLLDPRAVQRGSHAALPGEAPVLGSAAADALGAANAVTGFLGHNAVTSTIKTVLSPVATAVDTAKHFHKGVAVLAGLERIGQAVSGKIDAGVSTLVRAGVKASYVGQSEVAAGIAKTFGKSLEDATPGFLKRVAAVNDLANDPERLHRTITAQTNEIHDHAPETAQSIQTTSVRAISFLASKVPAHEKAGPLAPEPQPSRAEIAQFARYWEAIDDPLSIIKQASAGTITPEAVEAVATVYPELLGKIRAAVVDKLAARSQPVPYRTRIALSALLGQDVDGSLSPAMLMSNQAALRGPSQRVDAAPPAIIRPTSKGVGSVTLASRSLTHSQAVASRK